MQIGFSTGSLALDDFRRGVKIANNGRVKAIELSALRENELDPLISWLESLQADLAPFEYVSFHAPSRIKSLSEQELVKRLQKIADKDWSIIVHPDLIHDVALWKKLGKAVCIENMDRRKETGRTAAQLRRVFDKLPEATFCFDIGHARQVDPTMQEAESMLQSFGDRLRQVHMSYVNSQSVHERLNFESVMAFRRVSDLIKDSIPVILETPLDPHSIDDEVSTAESIFAKDANLVEASQQDVTS